MSTNPSNAQPVAPDTAESVDLLQSTLTAAGSKASFFSLKPLTAKLPAPIRPVGWIAHPVLDRALKLKQLSRDYQHVTPSEFITTEATSTTTTHPAANNHLTACPAPISQALRFAQEAIDLYGIQVQTDPLDLNRIPQSGPTIVVSNHPFGGIEGLILLQLLSQVRPDVKLLANHLLHHIPQMRDGCIFVNPFGSDNAKRANMRGMKNALSWLKQGGLLGVFPAGEVSALRWSSKGRVEDPAWSTHIAALAKRANANVVPMHIKGANSPLFQLAGLVHPRLRTVLLPREFVNKKDHVVCIRTGTPVSSTRLKSFENDKQAIDYLRLRSKVLRTRRKQTAQQRRHGRLSTRLKRGHHALEPIAPPIPTPKIIDELTALPREQQLVQDGPFQVFVAKAKQIPATIQQIGREREIAFRDVDEGSGKAIDLDAFDQHYHHLVLWHQDDQTIAGSYRIGRYAEILPQYGIQGAYLNTLFKFEPRLLEANGHQIIELGRSFIHKSYQRSFLPLRCLWKAITSFTAQNKDRYLIGPVSISNHYSKTSKSLMTRYLMSNRHRGAWSGFIKPRTPFSLRGHNQRNLTELAQHITNEQELSQIISDIEPNAKGMPVLLRQYLQWQAKYLAFNVDPDFNYCLDGLVLVDLPQSPTKTLNRYLGHQAAQEYIKHSQHSPTAKPTMTNT